MAPSPPAQTSSPSASGQWAGRPGTPFGDATRARLDPVEAVHKLAELGAYGMTFHDDDLVPFGTDDADRATRSSAASRAPCDETGMVVPMVTTNTFTHPVFKDGAFTSNDRSVRRYALRKILRNLDLAAELGAETFVFWGGREGAESHAGKDIRAALDRYAEGLEMLAAVRHRQGLQHAVRDRAQAQRAARRHPAARRSATRSRSSAPSSTPTWSASTPRSGHEQMAGPQLRARHRPGAVAGQAVPHRPQRPDRSEVRPGPGVRPRRPAQRVRPVDLLENGAPGGGPAYDGPRHFDYKPLRTEDYTGVWESASANMATYLLLKERAAAFRADPEVQEALAASKVAELAVPTLGDGRDLCRPAGGPVRLRGLRRRRPGRARLRLHPPQPAGPRAPARFPG